MTHPSTPAFFRLLLADDGADETFFGERELLDEQR